MTRELPPTRLTLASAVRGQVSHGNPLLQSMLHSKLLPTTFVLATAIGDEILNLIFSADMLHCELLPTFVLAIAIGGEILYDLFRRHVAL